MAIMKNCILLCLALLTIHPLSGITQAPQTNLIAAARAQLETWRAEPAPALSLNSGRPAPTVAVA